MHKTDALPVHPVFFQTFIHSTHKTACNYYRYQARSSESSLCMKGFPTDIVGFPKGINCTHLLADIFLYSCKEKYIIIYSLCCRLEINNISVLLHAQVHGGHIVIKRFCINFTYMIENSDTTTQYLNWIAHDTNFDIARMNLREFVQNECIGRFERRI